MTPSPEVLAELKTLVNDIRGKNTIVHQIDIMDAATSGKYPAVHGWLSQHRYSVSNPKWHLSCALKEIGLEAYTYRHNSSIRTWRVRS